MVRSHSHPEALVVFNELYSALLPRWGPALREPAHYNALLDLHLYDWQACPNLA